MNNDIANVKLTDTKILEIIFLYLDNSSSFMRLMPIKNIKFGVKNI